ncbi:uncharacterized protein LOC143010582 [Genypterus blacodes]|uniref:uncharacterized protein LOC143010582 n=1 Tax=Genypterus blacodes TaxID=154954 RepID=UPI003F76491D
MKDEIDEGKKLDSEVQRLTGGQSQTGNLPMKDLKKNKTKDKRSKKELLEELQKKTEAENRLKTQLETSEVRAQELQQQLQQKEREMKTMKSDMEQREREVTTMKSGMEQREREMTTMKSGMDQRERKMTTMKSDMDQRERKMTTMKSDMEQRERKMTTMKSDMEQREREVTTMKSGMEQREREMTTMKSDMDQRERKMTTMKSDMDQRERKMTTMKSDMEQRERKMTTMKSDMEQREREMTTMKSGMEQREREMTVFESTMNHLKEENLQLLEEVKSVYSSSSSSPNKSKGIITVAEVDLKGKYVRLRNISAEGIYYCHHHGSLHPTQCNTKEALSVLYQNVSDLQNTHPEGVVIVAGDFNQANTKTVLPHFHQHAPAHQRQTHGEAVLYGGCLCHQYITTRANQKPWMTNAVHAMLKARNSAFKSGDTKALRSARSNLNCAIREAKHCEESCSWP